MAVPDPDPESSLGEEDQRPRDKLGRPRGEQHKRVDQIEADRRTEVICKSIIEGHSNADILRYIQTQTDWDLSRRQIFRYIDKALKEVRASSKRERELELGKAIGRNEMIIRRALAPAKGKDGKTGEQDLRVAVRANALNARLLGLEAPVRLRHGGDPDSPPLPSGDFIVLVQEVAEG